MTPCCHHTAGAFELLQLWPGPVVKPNPLGCVPATNILPTKLAGAGELGGEKSCTVAEMYCCTAAWIYCCTARTVVLLYCCTARTAARRQCWSTWVSVSCVTPVAIHRHAGQTLSMHHAAMHTHIAMSMYTVLVCMHNMRLLAHLPQCCTCMCMHWVCVLCRYERGALRTAGLAERVPLCRHCRRQRVLWRCVTGMLQLAAVSNNCCSGFPCALCTHPRGASGISCAFASNVSHCIRKHGAACSLGCARAIIAQTLGHGRSFGQASAPSQTHIQTASPNCQRHAPSPNTHHATALSHTPSLTHSLSISLPHSLTHSLRHRPARGTAAGPERQVRFGLLGGSRREVWRGRGDLAVRAALPAAQARARLLQGCAKGCVYIPHL